jgi:membrane associated rhomboid family serine protease
LTHGRRLWTAFTSVFLHASLLQTFANMLFLAIFGPTVEDALGRLRFPLLYVLGGLLAVGCQVLLHPSSSVPLLGACGALAAVLGAYLVMYPRAQVLAVVPVVFAVTIVQVPALALLGFWLVLQLCFALAGIGSIDGGEWVALFSILVGLAFGLASIRPLLWRGRTERPLPVY